MRGLLGRLECAPHAFLFRAGEPSRHLYVLRAGKVKLTQSLPDGREQILGLCGARDLIGYDALTAAVYTHSAQALTPVAACRLAYKDAVEVLLQNPAVALRVIERLHAELARAQAHIRELGLKNATERVAAFLVSLLPPDKPASARLPLPLTRQEMAEHLGLSVETVSRIMTGLARQGVIRAPRGRNECLVLDPPRLRRMAGEGDTPLLARMPSGGRPQRL